MAQGLQCFDEKGNIILDLGDGLTKTLGSFDTKGGNGSLVDSRLNARYWVYPITIDKFPISDYDHTWHMPKFSLKGNILSWTYPENRRNIRCICYYGIY